MFDYAIKLDPKNAYGYFILTKVYKKYFQLVFLYKSYKNMKMLYKYTIRQ